MNQATHRGFSLVEMMVVIGIFTITMITVTASIVYFYRSNTYSLEQVTAITSGRRGIEYLTRDLREVTYAEDGAYPVATLGTSTVTFYADVDSTTDVEKVRYFLDSGMLMKGVIKATGNPLGYTGAEQVSIMAEYVRNLEKGVDIFVYKTATGTTITDLTKNQDVRFVRVSLIVNVNPNRLPEEFVLRGSATLRNLKDL